MSSASGSSMPSTSASTSSAQRIREVQKGGSRAGDEQSRTVIQDKQASLLLKRKEILSKLEKQIKIDTDKVLTKKIIMSEDGKLIGRQITNTQKLAPPEKVAIPPTPPAFTPGQSNQQKVQIVKSADGKIQFGHL